MGLKQRWLEGWPRMPKKLIFPWRKFDVEDPQAQFWVDYSTTLRTTRYLDMNLWIWPALHSPFTTIMKPVDEKITVLEFYNKKHWKKCVKFEVKTFNVSSTYRNRAINHRSCLVTAPLSFYAKKQFLYVFYVVISRLKCRFFNKNRGG